MIGKREVCTSSSFIFLTLGQTGSWLHLQEVFPTWIHLFPLERSGVTTYVGDHIALVTLPAQEEFPRQSPGWVSVFQMIATQIAGFAHLESEESGWRRWPIQLHSPGPRRDEAPSWCFSERFPHILS